MGGGPMGGLMRGGEKARNFKSTMKKLLSYLSPYTIPMIVVFVFAIASTVFTIIGPKVLGRATTKLFEGIVAQISGSGTGIDFDFIGNIIMIMVALYLASAYSLTSRAGS
jgi:ATP-binding cassette subfamily B protein